MINTDTSQLLYVISFGKANALSHSYFLGGRSSTTAMHVNHRKLAIRQIKNISD